MATHVSDDDYEVGYGKPPEHTKFKSGKSGNPRGRRRSIGPPDWEDPLKAVLRTKIPVTWNGERVKVPAFKALLMNTLKKALNGCTKSTKLLLDSTDGFKSIAADEKREITEAQRGFLEELRREVETWGEEKDHEA
jgi:Family of unknown function (DUF5681)